jgi:hypothetical protein
VKKLAIIVLLAAAACTRQVASSPQTSANAPGAATPREAVSKFMASAKVQDLQAMSNIWGGPKGPARETMDKESLEMREVIMMRCLRHDTYSVLNETSAPDGERHLSVEVRLRGVAARSNFVTTKGPRDRWYVKDFALGTLQSICTAK